MTEGHRQRLIFLDEIKKTFGSEVDVFGNGIKNLKDKWDALSEYSYSIVIENSLFNNYWTEKLADSFLAATYPIYFGAPNIYQYFPKNSLSVVNIYEPKQAILKIKEIIEGNYYQKYKTELKKARELILKDYQFFPHVVNLIEKHCNHSGEMKKIDLLPESHFSYTGFLKKIIGE